jgi:hypothetical protein
VRPVGKWCLIGKSNWVSCEKHTVYATRLIGKIFQGKTLKGQIRSIFDDLKQENYKINELTQISKFHIITTNNLFIFNFIKPKKTINLRIIFLEINQFQYILPLF